MAVGDERDRQPRALMHVVQRDFVRGAVEGVAEAVAERLHDRPLVFERLCVLDVDLEERDGNDHGGERYASAAASCSVLNASITSPTLISWNFSMPMPHSNPWRTSETSFLKCRSEPILSSSITRLSRNRRTLAVRGITP